MNPNTWKLIEHWYLEALNVEESVREAWVEENVPEEDGVRDTVRQMLGTLEDSRLDSRPGASNSAGGLEGQVLGEFQLLEVIGRGAMGTVYRAIQVPLDREVAVKVLALSGAIEELSTRFRREAKIASRLEHPGIVKVITFGEVKDYLYFAMELVDGWSLGTLLEWREERVEPGSEAPDLKQTETCIRLARDVAVALSYAHDQGIFHRDIKPHNILVDRDGKPRIADFGLAVALDMDSITQSGRVQGTPKYMSPEQAVAASSLVDHRTDIYSLGVVLYELLTGELPHEGETPQQLYYQIAHMPPVSLSRRAPNLPKPLVLVCMKAIRKRREERFSTAQDLASDLSHLLSGEPVQATSQTITSMLRDRMDDRRTVLRGAATVLGLSLLTAAGFAWHLRNEERAAWPRLQFDLIDAEAPVVVVAHRIPPFGVEPAESPALVDLGKFEGDRIDDVFSLDEDYWLIRLTDSKGGEAEVVRYLGHSSVSTAWVRLTKSPERLFGMEPVDGEASDDGGVFLDKATVTNGEFVEFRDLVLRRRAEQPNSFDGCSEEIAFNRVGEDRRDFDQLPVTGVLWRDASAFAEWKGKRLPFIEEWHALLDRKVEDWQNALIGGQLVVGWPMYAPKEAPVREDEIQGQGGAQGTGGTRHAYRSFVKPSLFPPHEGLGVSHPVGNVTEWLSSPGLTMDGVRSWQAWGGPWHEYSTLSDDPQKLASGELLIRDLKQEPRLGPIPPSADVGFRCALNN